MCTRSASTIRSAPATFLRPVPITRWYYPPTGVCLTKHHRGFIFIHPSALPQPVTPGWNEDPWASNLRLRTPQLPATHAEAGTAPHTGLGLHLRHQSNLLGDVHSTQATSRRKCSKRQCVTLTGRGPGARLINGITGPRDNTASAGTPTHFHVRKTSPKGPQLLI